MKALIVPAFALLLSACQHPYTTVYYGVFQPRSISRVAVTGGATTPVVPGIINASLAIDHESGIIYAGAQTHFTRWKLDGTYVDRILDPKWPHAVTLDQKRGHLYWADPTEQAILRCDLDGKNRTVIVQKTPNAYAVAFDSKHRVLYWSSGNPRGILRANADGTGVTFLAQATYSKGVAVDERGGRLFWSSPGFQNNTGKIICANLDGTNPKDVLTDLPWAVEGLAVDSAARRIFWIERHSANAKPARIRSAGFDGSDVQTVLEFTGSVHARSLALGWLPGEKK